MTNRRGALVAFGLAAFGGVGWLISRLLLRQPAGVAHASPSASGILFMDTLDDRLRADLARLASRVYSEEGIPVFLVCENLAATKTGQAPAPVPPTVLNTALASSFRRHADAWQRIRPDAPATDVAKLIEVLADRDVTDGGAEKTP